MHTLKKGVTSEMFARPELVDIDGINAAIKEGVSIDVLKGILPESFMQRRIVTMNYAALGNIISQRHDHRLPEWQVFCDEMARQVDFPEYLPTKL
jgi:thymidylate synthase ThyX